MEAPSGFEPEMEVLQTSALPLGYGARHWLAKRELRAARSAREESRATRPGQKTRGTDRASEEEGGAGNGIRTRDFDLGKVALYH